MLQSLKNAGEYILAGTGASKRHEQFRRAVKIAFSVENRTEPRYITALLEKIVERSIV